MDIYLLCTFSPIGIRATKDLAKALVSGGRKIVLGVWRSARLGIYWEVDFARFDYPGMHSRKVKYP